MNHNRYIPYFLLSLLLFGGSPLWAMDLEGENAAMPVAGAAPAVVFGEGSEPVQSSASMYHPHRLNFGDSLRQATYDSVLRDFSKSTGAPENAPAVLGEVNNAFFAFEAKRMRNRLPYEFSRNKAIERNQSNPSRWNAAQVRLWDFIAHFMGWYKEHEDKFSAAAKLMFMASAAAVVFHHTGGTEYMKRKIRDWFDRPQIYTVQQAGSVNTEKRRSSGQQLVLSPEVQRSVNGIVETLRWYNKLPKEKQRGFRLKGVLFHGVPGTGKTSLARVLAHRAGWDLIELSAERFNQIGTVAGKLRTLNEMFAEARKRGKTMIFLDELETIVPNREMGGDSPLLRPMLEQTNDGDVFVIGATNEFHKVDRAFKRRLKYKIEVHEPTTRQRYQIVRNYIEWLLYDNGYHFSGDVVWLAQQLHGQSGGEIENVIELLRDRARDSEETMVDEDGNERLVVDDAMVRDVLAEEGIIEPEVGDDILDRDAMLEAERGLGEAV